MSASQLVDQYGRKLDYLRLSVTDRCNFRCYYCMPEEGIDFAPCKELLSFEEMYHLAALFVELGIRKIRITGGEPFVRNGIIPFMDRLSVLDGLEEITVTSNGSLSARHQAALKEMGIRKINISLDSLDAARFFRITRRDSFYEVYKGIFGLLNDGFEVKFMDTAFGIIKQSTTRGFFGLHADLHRGVRIGFELHVHLHVNFVEVIRLASIGVFRVVLERAHIGCRCQRR